MTDIEKKFFDKIPIDKIYEDLFQPGFQKAGQALETVIEFGLTILLPIKLLNEKSKARLKKHLETFNKKLEKIDQEKICAVPEQIGLPIIDKLTYLNQPDLSDAFINLLTKASSFDTINLVHPAFLITLENLCSDEARILKHFNDFERIPLIDLHVNRYEENIAKPEFADIRGPKSDDQLQQLLDYNFQNRNKIDIKAAWNLTGIEKFVQLDFPLNIDIYIENLAKQGLINFERNRHTKLEENVYKELEESIYVDKIAEIKGWIDKGLANYKSEFLIYRGYIEFTEFGKAFIKACIRD